MIRMQLVEIFEDFSKTIQKNYNFFLAFFIAKTPFFVNPHKIFRPNEIIVVFCEYHLAATMKNVFIDKFQQGDFSLKLICKLVIDIHYFTFGDVHFLRSISHIKTKFSFFMCFPFNNDHKRSFYSLFSL